MSGYQPGYWVIHVQWLFQYDWGWDHWECEGFKDHHECRELFVSHVKVLDIKTQINCCQAELMVLLQYPHVLLSEA